MGRRFWTSDPHYFHKNVIRYCGRPFADNDEMHRVMIDNYNKVVGPDDTCYFNGDIFFCGTQKAAEIMAKLNGRKICIRGNHDHSAPKMRSIGFIEVHEATSLELKDGTFVQMSHFPYKPYMGDIPKDVKHNIEKALIEQRRTGLDRSSTLDALLDTQLAAGRLTQEQVDRLKNYDCRFFERRLENLGAILLCGHVHEKWAEKDRMINVGVDVRGFAPISEDEIIELINKIRKGK